MTPLSSYNKELSMVQSFHINPSMPRPSHYTDLGIEPIAFIMANGLDFAEGNVVKYVCRWRHKGGVDDLFKARQYIDFLIDAQSADAFLSQSGLSGEPDNQPSSA